MDIELKTPFVEWSKTEIAERGLELVVPYEMTWSCYCDQDQHAERAMPVLSG
jgi:7-cyano-7-deazaguanine synthase